MVLIILLNHFKQQVWMEFLKSRNLSTNLTSEQYYKAWEDLIDDPTSFAQKMKLDYDDVIDGT